ncbi:MAG: hypothetical protein EOP56_08470 [Sphingobacteriales bacterium]|nr:MAG: hypothetical protein EOP56_08470 [Sphingobacteriales bacterium]
MRRIAAYSWAIVLCMAVLAACKHKETVKPSPVNTGNNNNGGGNGNGGGGNGGGGGNQNPIDTGVCFKRDILPIFISNCAKSGCHDAASRQDGFQFTDYNSIVSKEFVAGNADATELYEKITEDKPEKRMPLFPNPPLTANQIYLIRRWINEGAKNSDCSSGGCDSTNFAYNTAIKPLTEKYCKGCHNAVSLSGGLSFDTYDGIKTVAQNGKLLTAIKHQPGASAMPKGGNKLSDCEIYQVEKWIANGAQNN